MASFPTIGELRTQLICQTRTAVKDADGQDVISYFNTLPGNAVVFAKVVEQSGRELETVRRVYAEATHIVTIRYLRALLTTARFLMGDRKLEVVSIANIEQRNRFLECVCREVRTDGS